MDCSGNSAGEEANVSLSFTFTTPDIKRTSEIHSSYFKRICCINSAFHKWWRVWCSVWFAGNLPADNTLAEQ